MPTLRNILPLFCLGFAFFPAFAQFGEAPAAPRPAAPAQEDVDQSPLRTQLLEHARRGDLQLADAISSLARTGRWSDVDRLLSQLPARNLDAASLAAISSRIGPAIFLRMKQNDQLSEPALAALDKIAEAARASAESTEKLQQAIDGLDSESIDTRLASARRLLAGGNAAVAELVAASVSDNPTAPRADILTALLEFGTTGIEALDQLARYGTPAVRNRAVASLARINRSAHLPDLLTALYATDSSEAERTTAQAHLSMLDKAVPSRSEALAILERDFLDKRAAARSAINDGQPKTIWAINENREGVTSQSTSAMIAAYRDVADAATRLRRMGGLSNETTSAALAADMAYRLLIDPDWGDREQIDDIRAAYGQAAGPEALSAGIGSALDDGDHAATIGLIRLIDAANASELERSELLAGSSAAPAPLVRAALSSDPQVRYEAALAAWTLADGRPFAGSSYVRRVLGEMQSLTDQPSVILVETRSEVILRIERILNDLGFRVDVVNSVSKLQRAVARGGDVRMIVSKIELPDLPPIEMIDLVRRAPRGLELPIVFYGAEDPALEWERWQAPTVRIEMPRTPAAFHDVLDAVNRKRRLPALSFLDRQTYREAADQQLAQ